MIKVLSSSNKTSSWVLDPGVPEDGNGTSFDNPFVWQLHSSNNNMNFDYIAPNIGEYRYVLLKLNSGVTYNGQIAAKTGPITYVLYSQSDSNTVIGTFSYYDSQSFSFSVNQTGLYIFKCGSEFYTQGDTETLTLNPAPEIISGEPSWKKVSIETSKGLDEIGYLNKYQDIDQANIKYSSFPVSNPAAYYLFDNPQNRLMDNSGNGNDGEIKGTVNFNENIALGSFSSSNYLRFPQLFTGTEDASISMFFQYKSQGGTRQWLISSGSEARSEQSASWILTIADSEVGLMQNYNDNFKDCPMVVDRWYHVVMQYENNVNYVYIDDTFEWSISTAHNLTKVATCIGYSGHLSNHWGSAFSGNVSQLSIFNRSLNSEERRALREFGKLQLGL